MYGMIVSPMSSAFPKTGEVAGCCKSERKSPLVGRRFHLSLRVGERAVRLPQLVVLLGKTLGSVHPSFLQVKPIWVALVIDIAYL